MARELTPIVLLLLSTPGLITALDPGCFTPGECARSLFLDTVAAPDPQSCLEACRESGDDCAYFTHYGDLSSCVLFADCVEFNINSCDQCFSGNVECPDLVCGSPGEFSL